MKTISPVRLGRHVMTLAVCGLALSTVSMLAQDNSGTMPPPPAQADQMGPGGGGMGHGGGREEHRLEMMTKRLNLTPDQVSQVKAIEMDSRTQARAVHEDASVAPADKRSKMMSIRDAANEKVRAVLNDEQKTKYDAMQAKMKERMQNHEGGGPPPPPPGV